jgi:hypothetical protein
VLNLHRTARIRARTICLCKKGKMEKNVRSLTLLFLFFIERISTVLTVLPSI